jgi:anti-sigma factor RsiW
MRCSSCEPLLDAYLEASLRRFEAHAVAAHLRVCHGCAALMAELRIVDALLTTARPPRVAADFTAAVVSATHATPRHAPRRMPLGPALLLYLGMAWALAIVAALRSHDLAAFSGAFLAFGRRDLIALGAAVHALAPATPVAAAAVTGVLLLDLLLLGALFYGYHRVRPLLALYLSRGPRS